MMNPKKRAMQLWRIIKKWTPDSSWSVPTNIPGITPRGLAELLIVKNSKPWVRLGFAIRERLTAAAKLNELLSTVEQSWPDLKEWAANDRRRLEREMSRPVAGLSKDYGKRWEQMLDIVQAIEDGDANVMEVPLCLEIDDCNQSISRLADYRDARALKELFRQQGHELRSRFGPNTDKIWLTERVDQPSDGRSVMQWALGNYLPAEWLFSWTLGNEKDSNRAIYRPLFELQRGTLDMSQQENILVSISESIDIPAGYLQNIRSIVSRMSEVIAELGYDEMIRFIMSDGGQSGPNSMIGNTAPINLIPGRPNNSCCPIVVAMASSSHRIRGARLPQILRDLRAHLIRCSHRSKLAVLVTDVWDPRHIEESRQDLLAHHEKGLQVIVLLAAGNRLTHLPVDLTAG